MRIVFHRDPEDMDLDTLLKLYGEALWYEHFRARLNAEMMWGKPKQTED